MSEGYGEFEATSLFCPRCRKAVAVRKKLLLVLPTGTKYDYLCAECGAAVGEKVDHNPAEFRRTVPAPVLGADPRSGGPVRPGLPGRGVMPPGRQRS